MSPHLALRWAKTRKVLRERRKIKVEAARQIWVDAVKTKVAAVTICGGRRLPWYVESRYDERVELAKAAYLKALAS